MLKVYRSFAPYGWSHPSQHKQVPACREDLVLASCILLNAVRARLSQAAAALVSVIMRASALENQHLFDFLARSNAVLS